LGGFGGSAERDWRVPNAHIGKKKGRILSLEEGGEESSAEKCRTGPVRGGALLTVGERGGKTSGVEAEGSSFKNLLDNRSEGGGGTSGLHEGSSTKKRKEPKYRGTKNSLYGK